MKNILISSILLITILIAACDPDEPTSKLDCESIYPVYESIINTSIFNFDWCAIENATEYHIEVSKVEDFSEIVLDRTVMETSVKSIIWLIDQGNGDSVEYFPLKWRTTYYWRVAAVKDSIQQDWSDTYIFETHDRRDDIVGTYEAKKRKLWQNHNGNFIYYDSVYSIHQIEVEKLPDSRGIRVKDITAGDFDLEMSVDLSSYRWMEESYEDGRSQFKIDIDSFEIQDIYRGDPPSSGFRYSGRE